MSCAERTLQNRRLPPFGRWNRPMPCIKYARKHDYRFIGSARDEEQAVVDYLRHNPDFLELYVVRNLSRAEVIDIINNRKRISEDFYLNRGRMFSTFNRKSIMQAIILDSTESSYSRSSRSSRPGCSYTDISKEKSEAIRKLTQEKEIAADKITILKHLHECLSIGTCGDDVLVYTLEDDRKTLCPVDVNQLELTPAPDISMDSGHPACRVALSQESLLLSSVSCYDEHISKYAHYYEDCVEAVLIYPIVKNCNETVAVVEILYSIDRPGFTENDSAFVYNICIWCGTVMNYTDLYHSFRVQQIMNKYILHVTQFMFSNIDDIDEVMSYIMANTINLVNATQAAFFTIEEAEFFSHIVDDGDENGIKVLDEMKCPRFFFDNSITGSVAVSGEAIIVQNASKDPRFNRAIDQRPNSVANSILCVPVKIDTSVVAVLQLLKHDGTQFESSDEVTCHTYSIYFGLALQVAKMYEEMKKSQQQYKVATEVLNYHSQIEEQEISCFKAEDLPSKAPNLLRFSYSPWTTGDKAKIINITFMYNELFSDSVHQGIMKDITIVSRFILTARKNHRNVPFHHWDHTYAVIQACYSFVKSNGKTFNAFEVLSLFVGCLCHDMDFNENCVTGCNDVNLYNPFGLLYNTVSQNGQNFNLTASILRNNETNLLLDLSSEVYKSVLMKIKFCLAATSFDNFFENKFQADRLLSKKGQNSWKIEEERNIMLGVCMSAFDLCVFYKPWDVHTTGLILDMERLYNLTEDERMKYVVVLEIMNREKADAIPEFMVTFMNNICLPTYLLIAQIFHNANSLVSSCRITRTRWIELSRMDKDKRKKVVAALRENVLSKMMNLAAPAMSSTYNTPALH